MAKGVTIGLISIVSDCFLLYAQPTLFLTFSSDGMSNYEKAILQEVELAKSRIFWQVIQVLARCNIQESLSEVQWLSIPRESEKKSFVSKLSTYLSSTTRESKES